MSYMSTDRISNHRLTTVIKATTDVKQDKTESMQAKIKKYRCR